MNTTTKSHTEPCARCGKPMPITRATLAAGLQHPACKYARRSLTASAVDLDAHALRVWSARVTLARMIRERWARA
jgi:hypothetical protein